MRVLIVDPSEAEQQQIIACLPSAWHASASFACGFLEATWAALTQRPDLIVLGLLLPDCTGIELLRMLRSMNPRAVIAVHSSYPVFEQRCRLEGADYFFRHFSDIRSLQDRLLDAEMVTQLADQTT